MHKITAQFYRYSKRVSELKSVSGSFSAQVRCSSRGPLEPSCVQFRRPVFERTPGALLRPRGPLAPSCVQFRGPVFEKDPWRPRVSIQNFLFKMTSSPRALQIHPTRSYTDSDLFGYTLLKNKIIFLQNDKIIIMNYPYLFIYLFIFVLAY